MILWCTRTLGDYPGWSDLLGGYPNEGTVAVRCIFDSPAKHMCRRHYLVIALTCYLHISTIVLCGPQVNTISVYGLSFFFAKLV